MTVRVAVMFPISAEQVQAIKAVADDIAFVDLSALPLARGAAIDEEQTALATKLMADVDVLLAGSNMEPRWIAAAGALRWWQIVGAGADRLLEAGLLGERYTVTNASGRAAVAIAESNLGYMLALAKGLPTSVRNQDSHRWRRHPTALLAGQTCAIAGLGAIGRETAIRARAFGMRVIASRRTVGAGETDPDCDELIPYSDFTRLVSEADYLVLCVPLTNETRNLVGREQLAAMKKTAFLINISRGRVIDQTALVDALRDGTIAGAAVDVTDPEPLPADSPLWDLPNVIITPHISGSVPDAVRETMAMFVANLRRFVGGEPLDNVVDPVLGY